MTEYKYNHEKILIRKIPHRRKNTTCLEWQINIFEVWRKTETHQAEATRNVKKNASCNVLLFFQWRDLPVHFGQAQSVTIFFFASQERNGSCLIYEYILWAKRATRFVLAKRRVLPLHVFCKPKVQPFFVCSSFENQFAAGFVLAFFKAKRVTGFVLPNIFGSQSLTAFAGQTDLASESLTGFAGQIDLATRIVTGFLKIPSQISSQTGLCFLRPARGPWEINHTFRLGEVSKLWWDFWKSHQKKQVFPEINHIFFREVHFDLWLNSVLHIDFRWDFQKSHHVLPPGPGSQVWRVLLAKYFWQPKVWRVLPWFFIFEPNSLRRSSNYLQHYSRSNLGRLQNLNSLFTCIHLPVFDWLATDSKPAVVLFNPHTFNIWKPERFEFPICFTPCTLQSLNPNKTQIHHVCSTKSPFLCGHAWGYSHRHICSLFLIHTFFIFQKTETCFLQFCSICSPSNKGNPGGLISLRLSPVISNSSDWQVQVSYFTVFAPKFLKPKGFIKATFFQNMLYVPDLESKENWFHRCSLVIQSLYRSIVETHVV